MLRIITIISLVALLLAGCGHTYIYKATEAETVTEETTQATQETTQAEPTTSCPYSDDELWLIAITVECEVGECGYEARYFAASTILNRADDYGGIEAAVMAEGQFEVVSLGWIYDGREITELTWQAVYAAIEHRDEEVYYFCSDWCDFSEWATLMLHIDGMNFYGR